MIIFYEAYNDLVPRMFNNFSEDYYHFRKIPYDTNELSKLVLYRLITKVVAPYQFSQNRNLLPHIWKYENLPDDDQTKINNFRAAGSSTYKRNLEQIILLASANKIPMVLSTFAFDDDLADWNDDMPEILWGEGIAENNLSIRELADQYGLPLIEFAEYAENDQEMFDDSIHMNDYGNINKKVNFLLKSSRH